MKFKYLFIDEVQSSEKAKKEIKEIVDFYKLNDENNYDYSDKDLINMRVLLDYITFLEKKVIEQQTRLHDIDKRSCDRLKRINEAVELLENPYNVDCISQCNDAIKKLTGKESKILKSYKN